MMLIAGKIITRPCGFFGIGLYVLAPILDQEVKNLIVFQELTIFYGEMVYWYRKCPRYKLVVQT